MASDELKRLKQMLGMRRDDRDVPLERFREDFERFARLFPVAPDVKVSPVRVAGVPAEWIEAPGASREHAVLFLHGGGYVSGSLGTHRELVGRLSAAAGVRCLSLGYRLAPEHPFPAALEDATAVYRELLARGQSPAKLALAGDSAGGGLALASLVTLRDEGTPLPAAVACISPWVDLTNTGASVLGKAAEDPVLQPVMLNKIAAVYAAGAHLRHPQVSPLYADLHGLPPLLLQVGTSEILLDDSLRLARRAREQGVEVTLDVWEDMVHDWHLFASLLPEGEQAIEELAAFLRGHLGLARVAAGPAVGVGVATPSSP